MVADQSIHIKATYNGPMPKTNQLRGIWNYSCNQLGTNSCIASKGIITESNIGPLNDDKNTHRQRNVDNDSHIINHEMPMRPPVSINIVDTDNIPVCMCSEISNTQIAAIIKNNILKTNICPLCHKIIKKQSLEPKYRLISKQLLLSNEIIINRIDTQHLSTYFDKNQEPYTPESAESHSPCPELYSFTTTSSDGCFSDADGRKLLDTNKLNVISCKTIDNGEINISQRLLSGNCDATSKQRGFVSPHQLKTRLEDLRQSSNQTTKFSDSCVAGDSDVEDINSLCNVKVDQNANSCLHKCCNIH